MFSVRFQVLPRRERAQYPVTSVNANLQGARVENTEKGTFSVFQMVQLRGNLDISSSSGF